MSIILDDTATSIGPVLRAHRLRKGLTQEELARKSGVHEMTICRIEVEQNEPRYDTIRLLAHSLGLTVTQFLTPPITGPKRQQSLFPAS